MESLKDRLTTAINDYGCSERAKDFDAGDMADYLMEVIHELQNKHNHKKGDSVKIREDLSSDITYGNTDATEDMIQYCGREAIIMEYNDDCEGGYLLDIDEQYWTWSDEMFKGQQKTLKE